MYEKAFYTTVTNEDIPKRRLCEVLMNGVSSLQHTNLSPKYYELGTHTGTSLSFTLNIKYLTKGHCTLEDYK